MRTSFLKTIGCIYTYTLLLVVCQGFFSFFIDINNL
nr:MAG TPA: hypothetical protein [Bacteriophage sp.]